MARIIAQGGAMPGRGRGAPPTPRSRSRAAGERGDVAPVGESPSHPASLDRT
jgi:hypothetical protein